jgi:hypothetical protein
MRYKTLLSRHLAVLQNVVGLALISFATKLNEMRAGIVSAFGVLNVLRFHIALPCIDGLFGHFRERGLNRVGSMFWGDTTNSPRVGTSY